MVPKIVVTKDLNFYPDQKEKLETLGEITYYKEAPDSPDEWYKRVKGSDIICTGMSGIISDNRIYDLENILIALPFVGYDFLNIDKLKEKNIQVVNAPGCNKEAVSEWVIGMILMFYRKLDKFNRSTDLEKTEFLKTRFALYNKNVTILGKGHIGSYLGSLFEAFNSNVRFFTRADNLYDSVKSADIVINCLALNKSTKGLLDERFFDSMKKGSLFVSAGRNQTYDLSALKKVLDNETLIGAIDDCASIVAGDLKSKDYLDLLKNPKIYVTPHIAWNTDSEARKANDIMIDNIEAWINKKPKNLIY